MVMLGSRHYPADVITIPSLNYGIDHIGDHGWRDFRSIHIGQVLLDLTHGHAACI